MEKREETMEFRQKVLQYIKEYQMLRKKDTIIIGLSGGADSICLLFLLKSLQEEFELSLQAVHVNHNLRGEEAKQDEQFVRELCAKLQIPLFVKSVDVAEVARAKGMSEEEAGRKIRYDCFEKIRKEKLQGKIAVAHHKNDQAETVLHHLCRGTSVAGAAGMRPVSGNIIRPFLCVTREEIEADLKCRKQEYRTDRTNFENKYLRNRIRNQIIPILKEQVNAQVVEHLSEAARDFGELAEYLEQQGNLSYKKMVKKESEQQYRLNLLLFREEMQIIKQWVIKKVLENLSGQHKNIDKKHIMNTIALIDKQVGKKQMLPYEITVWKEHDALLFEKAGIEEKQEEVPQILIQKEGISQLADGSIVLKTCFTNREKEKENHKVQEKILRKNCTKWFDYDKIENTVYLRKMQKGDYLQIDLAGHHKSASKACKDAKISAREQKHMWIVADGSHVLWIPGVRVSEYYKVSDNTERIWEISMEFLDSEE